MSRASLPASTLRAILLVALCGAAASGQPTAPPPAPVAAPAARPAGFTLTLRDWTRAESWQYFEPNPGGGDPDYAFVANRLQLELSRAWKRVDLQVTAQHVGFVGLPSTASGPGPLGLGALYYDQGGRSTHPQQLWLRYANVRVKQVLPGLDLRVGRMSYTSGAESASGDPKIEAVKRSRLDARIVGEFEWSIWQRGYDGVRADWSHGPATVTGIALRPTQGGFAKVAGPTIDDIDVYGATVSIKPTAALKHTQLQGFVLRYDDDRRVTQRPDNMGLTAPRVDIGITSLGGTLVGAYPVGRGMLDVLAWGVVQQGDWYGQDHGAGTLALEAGYHWTKAPWTPWVRAGLLRATGDDDPGDNEHGTYFPLLPTVRRFSQTTVFSTMNVHDTFVQVMARPAKRIGMRLDVHDLRLAEARDLWYIGSGATLEEGAVFGYSGRRSNGSTALGTSIEGSVDVTVSPIWSINAFVGHVQGGRVVTGTFRGNDFWFAYVEQVLRLDDVIWALRK